MSPEERQKIINYRHITEITFVLIIIIFLLSLLFRPTWPYGPKIYLTAIPAASALYTIIFFHLIPDRWKVSRWITYLDPIMAITLLFLLLEFTQGISGEVFYFFVIILIIAALAENGNILFPVAAYIAFLHTLTLIFDPRLMSSFQEHPTTFLGRYVTLFMVAYIGRFLSREAWQQRQAKEKLEELQRVKNEFIFIASHSLRTPITTLRGYLQNLLSNLRKYSKEDREILTHVNANVEKLLTLTEDLVDVASLEGGTVLIRSDFDLKEMVKSLMLEFSPQASIRQVSIIADVEEDIPKIHADERRIRGVLMHLLSNAIKFNKEGGKVKLKAYRKDGNVNVSVSDTGVGIPKDEQAKIFDKFYRVGTNLEYNYEGEGLGLYLSKLIIEAHRGKIWVESTPGKGSTFAFTFPIKQKK